jgi:hypothetical protein
VALPNACQPRATARAGVLYWFPDPATADYDFTLAGPPGRERILALSWVGRAPLPLAPEGGADFRGLSPDEVARLCDALDARDPETWAACLCEFEAVPAEAPAAP